MAPRPDDKLAAKFSSQDSALIRELALLLDETGLSEIEIERAGFRVRVARSINAATTEPGDVHPPAAAAHGAPAPAAVAMDLADHPGVVPSPMVGTAYWA